MKKLVLTLASFSKTTLAAGEIVMHHVPNVAAGKSGRLRLAANLAAR